MSKAPSRPGTAKSVRAGTSRPVAASTTLAATALAANDGVCLQISNKKDERAKKVLRMPCKLLVMLCSQPCLDALWMSLCVSALMPV